jgi:hypothetical protein
MRVRAQDANGDMTFGRGASNFLVNSPAAVAQLVLTGLGLLRGEWFLDKTAGMPWTQSVIGTGTKPLYDLAIQSQILNTQGVTGIENYSSSLDPVTRKLTIPNSVVIDTQFGRINLPTTVLP